MTYKPGQLVSYSRARDDGQLHHGRVAAPATTRTGKIRIGEILTEMLDHVAQTVTVDRRRVRPYPDPEQLELFTPEEATP